MRPWFMMIRRGRDRLDLGQDVRREQHGVLHGEALDELAHVDALQRVEAARRLVEDQDLRVRQERHREAGALAQTAREVADEVARAVLEADALQHRGDAQPRLLAGHAVECGLQREHLLDAVLAVQRHGLGQVADPTPDLHRLAQDVEARDARRAGRGGQVARQHAHGGRLARAIRPEEPDDLPSLDAEADVVDRTQGAEAAGEVLDFDHGSRRVAAGTRALNEPRTAGRARDTENGRRATGFKAGSGPPSARGCPAIPVAGRKRKPPGNRTWLN